MKIIKILSIIGIAFTLTLLFIAGGIIRSYGKLEDEAKNQLLSEQSVTEDTGLDTILSQPGPVATDTKDTISKQKDTKPPLNLKLIGTILGEAPLTCIKDLTLERQGVYEVGDIISGTKIVDIQRGEVTLERDGRKELLVFADGEVKAVTEISPTERIVSKKGILKEIGSNIKKALTMVRVLPHFNLASRKFSGLKIDKIKKGSIIESAGLRNGDIIKVVNNQELTTPQKAIQVFRKVRNQPQINVGLLRKNQLIKLRYNIKD